MHRAMIHGFYAEEIAYRKHLSYPPAVRLAAIRFDAPDPQAVEQFCQAFVASCVLTSTLPRA